MPSARMFLNKSRSAIELVVRWAGDYYNCQSVLNYFLNFSKSDNCFLQNYPVYKGPIQ